MPEEAQPERVKRSTYYDRRVLDWLRRRGERLDRSVDWQVREILRAAMDDEQHCQERAS